MPMKRALTTLFLSLVRYFVVVAGEIATAGRQFPRFQRLPTHRHRDFFRQLVNGGQPDTRRTPESSQLSLEPVPGIHLCGSTHL